MKALDVNVSNIDECTVGIHTCSGDMIECDDKAPGFNCRCATGYELNFIFGSNDYQCLDCDECDHTHVNAILISLVMDSNVLIFINAMITHVMLLQLVPTALVHSAVHVIRDGLVMDSHVLITTNAKTVFNGWTKFVLTMHSALIPMVASHATVTLDTLVTVLMSASITTNVRVVTMIAMLMHLAPILTAVHLRL